MGDDGPSGTPFTTLLLPLLASPARARGVCMHAGHVSNPLLLLMMTPFAPNTPHLHSPLDCEENRYICSVLLSTPNAVCTGC